jgi:UDP-N-acetylmuramate dehydrogenase
MPSWETNDGRVKLSAGWLIERAGFERGFAFGRAGLSQRHALAIINRGGARAADIVALASLVRRGVRNTFGVTLVPEPVFVGFDSTVDDLLH